MSLLNTPSLENATGEVKEILQEIKDTFGEIPEGVSLWSVSPRAFKTQWNFIKESFTKDKDTQKLHTIIRYLISEEDDCKYCIGFNGGMLINMYDMSQESLPELKNNLSVANLSKKNQALLNFAMKSFYKADDVDFTDIQELKSLGNSEKDIFEIVEATSHMVVVNTLFKTFKV